MNKLTWKFTMDLNRGPSWDMYEDDRLVAYAKRAKDTGWFVRISELNPTPGSEKIYIGEDVFPVSFMKTMLAMHKKEKP